MNEKVEMGRMWSKIGRINFNFPFFCVQKVILSSNFERFLRINKHSERKISVLRHFKSRIIHFGGSCGGKVEAAV